MTPAATVGIASVEVVAFAPQSERSATCLARLAAAAQAGGLEVRCGTTYAGGADVLVLWGPGAPDRQAAIVRQVQAGGHAVCWDLAYWDRDRKARVSIDAAHPQAWVMRRRWPGTRFAADAVAVRDVWNPHGPVLVAGIGDKARRQYGQAVDIWERAMTAEAVRRGHRVRYRPKRDARVVPIDRALQGAGLVITWHSNVAVDAVRHGIPVICRDGAAAAVCPSAWPAPGVPLAPLAPDVRRQFLDNLAWFQWAPLEAAACWRFLRTLLEPGAAA